MKVVFIVGSAAVGKMTVGQALMERTGLRLFHNHMMIEPVIEIFGAYDGQIIDRLRDVVFEAFAASEQYGMIFTFMWAFDVPGDWAYIEHVQSIFRAHDPGAEFYFVELVAPQEIRLRRNASENRLKNKASKNNIAWSNQRLIEDDAKYRLESLAGEIPFENYMKLDNSELEPAQAAQQIQLRFSL